MKDIYRNIPTMGPTVPSGNNGNQYAFDLNQTGNELRFDVRQFTAFTVTARALNTWATAVLTVYRSTDGVATTITTGTLSPATALAADIDTGSQPYVIVRLTTLEGSQQFATILVHGKQIVA